MVNSAIEVQGTSLEHGKDTVIGVLDIYGFEIFDDNRLDVYLLFSHWREEGRKANPLNKIVKVIWDPAHITWSVHRDLHLSRNGTDVGISDWELFNSFQKWLRKNLTGRGS